jgi:molecular chaperone HtpG
MKPNQEAIYILVGDDVDALKRSAQIEGFSALRDLGLEGREVVAALRDAADRLAVVAVVALGPEPEAEGGAEGRRLRREGEPAPRRQRGAALRPGLRASPAAARSAMRRISGWRGFNSSTGWPPIPAPMPAPMLVDLAHVQGGDPPRDPVAFARRVASALAQG